MEVVLETFVPKLVYLVALLMTNSHVSLVKEIENFKSMENVLVQTIILILEPNNVKMEVLYSVILPLNKLQKELELPQ